jgi:signal transduction histidine kinase
MPMTLRRKITFQLSAMLLGVLLVSAAALWGLNGLHQDYGVALEGYQRLRQVYEAASHLRLAQKLLMLDSNRPAHPRAFQAARDEVHAAGTSFQQIARPDGAWDASADQGVRDMLAALETRVAATPAEGQEDNTGQAEEDAINDVLAKIPALAAGIRATTEASQLAGQRRRHETIAVVAILCGVVVVGTVLLGVLQYRSVIRPLRRLGAGVRKVASGHFQDRLEPRGGEEFASLAGDFNRMAGELDGFYHELERKVADKTRELIRSERLASVGYLAAGVAHEINNPLGIISGYAEYSLGELRRGSNGSGSADSETATSNGSTRAKGRDADVEKSLQIICDEAFRCKEITEKLLALARPGDDNRVRVSLATVADHVASIVRGLQPYRDRNLLVEYEPDAELTVSAVEAQMKQVMLNLTVNALEATSPGKGEVRVAVRSLGSQVELSVTDNGRGMSADTVEHVFEPFFTEKRGRDPDGRYGTGLGLAITHAIIAAHGGSVEASSDGAGKGSRFVVRLPLGDEGVEDGGSRMEDSEDPKRRRMQ